MAEKDLKVEVVDFDNLTKEDLIEMYNKKCADLKEMETWRNIYKKMSEEAGLKLKTIENILEL